MMTEEEIDQIVEATGPPPGKRWTAPFRRFATWFATTRMGILLGRKTKVWNLIVAVLVMAAGYPLVINSIGATNAHLLASDRRANANGIYVAQLLAYSNAQNAYSLCLDGVGRSDKNLAQWSQLVDIIAALDSGSGQAIAFAGQIRNGPLLSAPPRTAADCPNPGDPPEPPSSP